MTLRNWVLFVPLMFLLACISAEQTTDDAVKKTPDVYVFDDIKKIDEPKPDSAKTEVANAEIKNVKAKVDTVATTFTAFEKRFTVQLGAFTTKERADLFIKENQSKTSLPLLIQFNAKTKLFAVQVPPYKTKDEADIIRDNLRKFSVFSGSFTVIVEN